MLDIFEVEEPRLLLMLHVQSVYGIIGHIHSKNSHHTMLYINIGGARIDLKTRYKSGKIVRSIASLS